MSFATTVHDTDFPRPEARRLDGKSNIRLCQYKFTVMIVHNVVRIDGLACQGGHGSFKVTLACVHHGSLLLVLE